MKQILLGYDGSESANHALTFAADMAQRYSAELHILAVARPPEFGDEVETAATIESGTRHCEKVLDLAKARLAGVEFRSHFRLAIGHPAEQIVRDAETHAIDHIVVGHRGHTLFERWLIGSVARQVIAYAYCAVTVVR